MKTKTMTTDNSNQEDLSNEDCPETKEELSQIFLDELNENIQQLEVDFVIIEKEPENIDMLNKIFRIIHSMKGVVGYFAFKNLESLLHKMEEVLNKLRKRELYLGTDIMDILLCAVDVMKEIHEEIRNSKRDILTNTEDIKDKLYNIIQDTSESSQNKISEDLTTTAKTRSDLSPEHQTSKSITTTPGTMRSEAVTQIRNEEVRSVRIDVNKLDSLFNLVGELVLSRNSNMQLYRLLSKRYPEENTISKGLAEAVDQLDYLTSELQCAVMKTRMMPISTVFNKFSRIIRDVGKTLGKEIKLNVTGDNTEIDKNIIEGIGDPMIHIIRNSADHGIETPDERIKAGKDTAGRIDVNAYYEGNYVVIETKDDGKGIDPEALKKKAIEKSMITPEAADNMTKEALIELIFKPGLSTTKEVSAVSGRGVGMDVVKTKIEGLRGQIEIDSQIGAGTVTRMKIPLTMAVLDALIVNVSDHRYAVPVSNIVEIHRMKYGQIEKLRGNMVFRMREELLPVATLSEIIRLPFEYDNVSKVTLLVLRNGLHRMGIIVDKTAEQEEVVVKSIDCLEGIAEPRGVSGATILGDGSITFILDVNALMNISNAASLHTKENVNVKTHTSSQPEENLLNVVVVENLGKEQYAIPTRNVSGIEIINKADIEEVSGISVIRYRGRIISLTDIPTITKVTENKRLKNYYMIILADKENEVGLLVERLLGIKNIDGNSFNEDDVKLNGVIGSAIFEERITLLLNPDEIKKTALNQRSLTEGILAVHSAES